MAGNPKYYLRQSFTGEDWKAICISSNNVVVADVANEVIAELFLEFLNDLPGKRQPHLKKKARYPNLRKEKKITSE